MARKKKKKQDEPKDREWIITQALLQGWTIQHMHDTQYQAVQVTDKLFAVNTAHTKGRFNLSETIEALESHDTLNNWQWDDTIEEPETRTTTVITLDLGAATGARRGRK